MPGRELAYWQAHVEALHQEMQRDPTVIVMGEDVAGGAGRTDKGIIDAWGGPFGTTRGLIKEFGADRVRDTPISETAFIGAAVGAAMAGYRPWVELMYAHFIGVCLDQLLNNAARAHRILGSEHKVKVPIVVKTWLHVEGILYAIFTHIPGLKVVAPSSPYTVKGLLISSIRDDNPVIFCDNLALLRMKGEVPEEPYTIPIGKADVKKEGKDITLVGMSNMTNVCMQAAEKLEKDGINAEVIDLLSLSPLDEDTILASVRRTKHLVVVDEDYPRCSVAKDIAAVVADKAFDYLDAPIKTVNSPHAVPPYNRFLEHLYPPNPEKVAEAARSILR
ncbi:MAG: alpha-ketoacid dehydrogenase subunit beta [Chloroflexi bacterium]|nr:alpha-ketoacid dehydrogenase subunit beta [Chloroflexota bacterium]